MIYIYKIICKYRTFNFILSYVYFNFTKKMITPSKLRQDLYNLLDLVIATGKPIEIKRKNKVLKIIIEQPKPKIANLKKRDVFNCPPDEIINSNWEEEWKV